MRAVWGSGSVALQRMRSARRAQDSGVLEQPRGGSRSESLGPQTRAPSLVAHGFHLRSLRASPRHACPPRAPPELSTRRDALQRPPCCPAWHLRREQPPGPTSLPASSRALQQVAAGTRQPGSLGPFQSAKRTGWPGVECHPLGDLATKRVHLLALDRGTTLGSP